MRNVTIVILAILLASCQTGVSIGEKDDPCVIQKVEQADSGFAWYRTTNGPLKMQAGLFDVGDTLDFLNLGISRRLVASYYSKIPISRVKSTKTEADTTLSLEIRYTKITPGLLVGVSQDTLIVGYDSRLIEGR